MVQKLRELVLKNRTKVLLIGGAVLFAGTSITSMFGDVITFLIVFGALYGLLELK